MRKYICVVASPGYNNVSTELCSNMIFAKNGDMIEYEEAFKNDILRITNHELLKDVEIFFLFDSYNESDFIDTIRAIEILSRDEYLDEDCSIVYIDKYCSFSIGDILVVYHEQ